MTQGYVSSSAFTDVQLHVVSGAAQNEEVMTVTFSDGSEKTMRLHDYAGIYRIPGLYEYVLNVLMQYGAPDALADALVRAAKGRELRVFDLGAGTGLVGHALHERAVQTIVGSDCLVEARAAVERDRPGLYADYVLDDGRASGLKIMDETIGRFGLNALAIAGAIDADHITPERLAEIWKLFPRGSWIGFTGSVEDFDSSSAAQILEDLAPGTNFVSHEQFRHRTSMEGTPIYRHAIVGHRP